MKYIFLFVFSFLVTNAKGQQAFRIAIVSDIPETENQFFEEAIQNEIEALLGSRIDLRYSKLYGDGTIEDLKNKIQRVYSQNQADVLIGVGILSSNILTEQSSYPIPTIAAVQLLDAENQNKEFSNVSNFTYINSPFNFEAGLDVLKQICQCEKLAILTPQHLSAKDIGLENLLANKDAVQAQWLSLEQDLLQTIPKIPNDIEGVYVMSTSTAYSPDEIKLFFDEINQRKLPSFTLIDMPMLGLGAYASFSVGENLKQIPRRIALNVEKIIEGKNPKDFPVGIETFSKNLVVNMQTVNRIGKYPDWQLLDKAMLININSPPPGNVLNLATVIAEALKNNIGYQIAAKQTQISRKDVGLARSNYLPQLKAETDGIFLDQNTVNNSFGMVGDFNWTAGASFTQLILSEPAMANIAIQKLLNESQQEAQNQSQLDVVLEVVQRYFNYLQVQSIAELQNNNIKAINQNLSIATNKEKVGYSGVSDVYRWNTELNLAKSDLYETNAQLKAAGYSLNESLNRPIGEPFSIQDSENIENLTSEVNGFLFSLIPNEAALIQLSDFLVAEAFNNLPEIKQINLALSAQQRLLKSNKRAFYIPTLGFGANYEYPIETVNPGEPPPIPGFEPTINPSWNAAMNLSFPVFSGASRKLEKEKTQVGMFQLEDQRRELKNLLELQIRSNVQLVNASVNNMRLTEKAAEEAGKNVKIVQDFYRSGQVDIITLVDAQNSLLGSQINATNAQYQFIINYFALQRSFGYYFLIDTQENRSDFIQRFSNFKSQ